MIVVQKAFLNPDTTFYAYPNPPDGSEYSFAIVFLNQFYIQALSDYDGIRALCAHEVGHIFSLVHSGEDSSSLMYANPYYNYLNGGPRGPTAQDVDVVHNAYPEEDGAGGYET